MFKAETTAPRPVRPAWHREHDLPPSVIVPSVLAAAAGLVAMWPYTSVIAPGTWSATVLLMIVVTGLTGVISRTALRRRRAWQRDLATMGLQIVVAGGALTLLVAGGTALFGVIPTERTLVVFQGLAVSAWDEIVHGVAPLESSPGLAAMMGVGFAFVAIVLDALVAQRGAVVASLLTAAVGATPMIATLGDADIVWFVVFGLLVLALLRYTAVQDPETPRRTSTVLAAGVGVAALASTIVIAPALPLSPGVTGTGVGVTVDASLRLGDDLRQPNPVEVLTLATSADTAPYLRLTTLSQFDGRVWEPDRGGLQAQSEGFGPDEWSPDITTTEQNTSIRVIRMSSSWLPVPYPATSLQGVPAAWRVSPDNRTVASRTANAVGNDYTVRSTRVSPTLEQIRAIPAAEPVVDPDAEPVALPDVIAATAQDVTAAETNDYDRLIALQSWFRNQFSYSLETPVDEGFDGTGADAVARFLEVRSGYCIHFAGAFALMAESLGMDVRIVVGYLPGALTDTSRGEESVYSVTSDQLHSWPEVRFPGVGWVPFEPTASLGVPTAFAAGTTTGGGSSGTTAPTQTTAPSTEQTSAPEVERDDAGDNAGATGERQRVDPTPIVLGALGVLLVLLLPAAIRLATGAVRRANARRGDAASAWAELRATMLDLGVTLSDAESPRMRGDDLVRDNGVDAGAMRALTDAVERASYAQAPGGAAFDLEQPLRLVLGQLRRSVNARTRILAFAIPRSLFVSRRSDGVLAA
nr:DUF3488 and transglutaminase-like domain-containing protein [Microbacterium hydrocarbonoxydans]